MRISTGLRIFAATSLVGSIVAGFIACSGDDGSNNDVTTPDAGQDVNKPDTAPYDAGNDTGPADTGPKDTGPSYDAGPVVILDGGDMYEGGVACVANGLIEEEVNDTPDAANPLQPVDAGACLGSNNKGPGCSRCGVIFKNDPLGDGGDGGTELEYVSFDLHPTAKTFYIQYSGDVTLTVSVEGHPDSIIGPTSVIPDGGIPFDRMHTYYIRVTSNTGARTPWRVTLYEDE